MEGNAIAPWTILNAQGADALRWYLYSSSPPDSTKRFSQALIEDTLRDFFMTLWNTYSFLVLYANLDRPDLKREVPVIERPEIDRWLVAKVNSLVRDVTDKLEAYDPTSTSRLLRDFVVNDLSNWYIRRNRRDPRGLSSRRHPPIAKCAQESWTRYFRSHLPWVKDVRKSLRVPEDASRIREERSTSSGDSL